jgi:hypothetical protein
MIVLTISCLSACSSSSSLPKHGFSDAATSQQLVTEELKNYGLVPPVPRTSAFEAQLLTHHPLTFAIYQEAMQALSTCASQTLPGLTVTFTAGTELPYMYDVSSSYNPQGNQEPPAIGPILGKCASEYSAEVEADWEIQNRTSGAALIPQRQEFVSCLRAAGVQISLNASYAQIHTLINTRGWGGNLSGSQQSAANNCLRQYAAFVSSL